MADEIVNTQPNNMVMPTLTHEKSVPKGIFGRDNIKTAKITPQDCINREANIPCKEIDKEGILLNLETGDYFALNEVGIFIWKSLSGNKNLGQIAAQISTAYSISKAKALAELLVFAQLLAKKRLITLCDRNKAKLQ